ncbi:unnamed protein product [Adineta ricciae]|nr:unnamed protein product [Adineta ricciae]
MGTFLLISLFSTSDKIFFRISYFVALGVKIGIPPVDVNNDHLSDNLVSNCFDHNITTLYSGQGNITLADQQANFRQIRIPYVILYNYDTKRSQVKSSFQPNSVKLMPASYRT